MLSYQVSILTKRTVKKIITTDSKYRENAVAATFKHSMFPRRRIFQKAVMKRQGPLHLDAIIDPTLQTIWDRRRLHHCIEGYSKGGDGFICPHLERKPNLIPCLIVITSHTHQENFFYNHWVCFWVCFRVCHDLLVKARCTYFYMCRQSISLIYRICFTKKLWKKS